jgi:hypothetical protein
VYPDGAFSVTQERRTDSVRIFPRGELDMLTAPILDADDPAHDASDPTSPQPAPHPARLRLVALDPGRRVRFCVVCVLEVLSAGEERAYLGGELLR